MTARINNARAAELAVFGTSVTQVADFVRAGRCAPVTLAGVSNEIAALERSKE